MSDIAGRVKKIVVEHLSVDEDKVTDLVSQVTCYLQIKHIILVIIGQHIFQIPSKKYHLKIIFISMYLFQF